MSAQRVYLKSAEFQPRNDFILIKPIELKTDEATESGIIISINSHNSVLDRSTSGEVVDIGKDIKDVEIGSIILWPGTDGLDIEFDDGVFMLLRYESIIGTKKD
jgi:co-chaperonin GroES (HSP10)